MVSSDDGWAVSGDTYHASILHWDGTAWAVATTPTINTFLSSISMASSSDGWAVGGNGLTLHWDGLAWRQVANPFPEDLFSVSAAAPPDVWAVGEHHILYGNGRTWVRVPRPPAQEPIRSLAMVSDDGWAVGYGGLILRYSPYLPVRHLYLPSISAQRPDAASVRSSIPGGRP